MYCICVQILYPLSDPLNHISRYHRGTIFVPSYGFAKNVNEDADADSDDVDLMVQDFKEKQFKLLIDEDRLNGAFEDIGHKYDELEHQRELKNAAPMEFPDIDDKGLRDVSKPVILSPSARSDVPLRSSRTHSVNSPHFPSRPTSTRKLSTATSNALISPGESFSTFHSISSKNSRITTPQSRILSKLRVTNRMRRLGTIGDKYDMSYPLSPAKLATHGMLGNLISDSQSTPNHCTIGTCSLNSRSQNNVNQMDESLGLSIAIDQDQIQSLMLDENNADHVQQELQDWNVERKLRAARQTGILSKIDSYSDIIAKVEESFGDITIVNPDDHLEFECDESLISSSKNKVDVTNQSKSGTSFDSGDVRHNPPSPPSLPSVHSSSTETFEKQLGFSPKKSPKTPNMISSSVGSTANEGVPFDEFDDGNSMYSSEDRFSENKTNIFNPRKTGVDILPGRNVGPVGSSVLPYTNESRLQMAFSQAYGISLMTAYTGPDELAHILVTNNLETYLREQVFGVNRPSGLSPYILRSANSSAGHYVDPPSNTETFITFYREKIVDLSESGRRLSSTKNGINLISVVLIVTDVNLYIILDDFNATSRFHDAPVPILVRSHPIQTLM